MAATALQLNIDFTACRALDPLDSIGAALDAVTQLLAPAVTLADVDRGDLSMLMYFLRCQRPGPGTDAASARDAQHGLEDLVVPSDSLHDVDRGALCALVRSVAVAHRAAMDELRSALSDRERDHEPAASHGNTDMEQVAAKFKRDLDAFVAEARPYYRRSKADQTATNVTHLMPRRGQPSPLP